MAKVRLIDANALADLMDVEYRRKMKLVRKGEAHLDTLAEGLMSMSVLLGTMPTVDTVEVVYCQDCAKCKKGFCTIRKDSWGATLKVGLHDFCSDGERRKADGKPKGTE